MSWELIEQGSPAVFGKTTPNVENVPSGTPVRLEIDTLPGVGYLADVFGIDTVVNELFGAGMNITGHDHDSSHVIVEGYANSPIIPILLAISLVIGGIAWLIREMRFFADTEVIEPISNILKWVAIGTVGVLGIVVVTKLVGEMRK